MKKGSKYGNIKTEYNGVLYDSKAEARRAIELDVLLKAGDIENLRRQVPYPLMVNDKKIGTYKADFVYFDKRKQKEVVEDVKGMVTAVFKIKQKILEANGVEITIIK